MDSDQYPVDNIIKPLNNCGQVYSNCAEGCRDINDHHSYVHVKQLQNKGRKNSDLDRYKAVNPGNGLAE